MNLDRQHTSELVAIETGKVNNPIDQVLTLGNIKALLKAEYKTQMLEIF